MTNDVLLYLLFCSLGVLLVIAVLFVVIIVAAARAYRVQQAQKAAPVLTDDQLTKIAITYYQEMKKEREG